jgi:hypothetical protein
VLRRFAGSELVDKSEVKRLQRIKGASWGRAQLQEISKFRA